LLDPFSHLSGFAAVPDEPSQDVIRVNEKGHRERQFTCPEKLRHGSSLDFIHYRLSFLSKPNGRMKERIAARH